MIARMDPIIVLVIIGFKIRKASIAPTGSDIPEIKVYPIAFFLFFVAWYTGTDILIPSGILWRAMAIVIAIPNDKLVMDNNGYHRKNTNFI